MTYCGLDFGTSNSAIAIRGGNAISLAPVDNAYTTTPTAMFFAIDGSPPVYGRQAIEHYIDGDIGRLLRGLKSILGTALIDEQTRIGKRQVSFRFAIGAFLEHLKSQAEDALGSEIDSVVLGRPVHFVASNRDSDGKAEATLIDLAKAAGFRHVAVQFEPIAAALHYETLITREEVALIVDIGGGTSDFSVVRVAPERKNLASRKSDILANGGVRIGGTDLDQRLSLATAMPLLGHGAQVRAEFGETLSEAPAGIFHELSIWHRIIFAYNQANLRVARELRRLALERSLFDRLLIVLEERLAHRIAQDVEKAKIDLSDHETTTIDLATIEPGLIAAAHRNLFEDIIDRHVADLVTASRTVVQDAGLRPSDISSVFFTGGSSHIPKVRKSIEQQFPDAESRSQDMFGSVGLGLGLDAQRRFRGASQPE